MKHRLLCVSACKAGTCTSVVHTQYHQYSGYLVSVRQQLGLKLLFLLLDPLRVA